MSTSTYAARYSADHIETGEGDEACSECDGDGCRACHWRGLVTNVTTFVAVPATTLRTSRCYACDAVPVGHRDRRPEGGHLEPACSRHAEPALLARAA